MIVAAVTRDKRHQVRVTANDGQSFLVDTDVAAEYALAPGVQLGAEKLAEITERSDFVRAKERALWYLDHADHTEKALYDKLKKAGFPPRPSAAVIAWLREYGLIDDRRFAARYAEQCAEANISSREAYFKMTNKGVPREMAKAALDALSVDETAQIRALLEKKYRNKLGDPAAVQKVFAALIRKGFSFGAVRDVLKQYAEELQNMSEES